MLFLLLLFENDFSELYDFPPEFSILLTLGGSFIVLPLFYGRPNDCEILISVAYSSLSKRLPSPTLSAIPPDFWEVSSALDNFVYPGPLGCFP